uniref:Uncharacterized protein n=1 Tax=Oryza sativa subsp. japonica TaxID=39947 RepID=Q6H586_ORYSJ|nr:hypothetical protein [Oryza sativa Japonica Group]BAD26113.1 hypothetical protein [Oryza sativa Japonica Group]
MVRYIHQNSFWHCAHVQHRRKPSASGEGTGVGVTGSSVPLGSSAVVAASSSMSGEARRRRRGATAGIASTTAPAASSTMHWSPKDPLKLLQETMKVACTEVAGKGGFGCERNRTSHSYPARADGSIGNGRKRQCWLLCDSRRFFFGKFTEETNIEGRRC